MMFYLWPCLIKMTSPQETSKTNNQRHQEPYASLTVLQRQKKARENWREDTKS